MQYLIAYPIRGEAGTYHAVLSNALAERFKLEPITSRIDPHLTLKAPFDAPPLYSNSRELENSHIRDIENLLEVFTKKEKPLPLRLEGFNYFDGNVLFMDAHAPKQTHMLTRRLQDQLRHIPSLTFKRTEFPLTLHATLCYPKNPQQTKEILHYLQHERAGFDLVLDTIAILEKSGPRWHIVREFPIGI